jgi:hypothetical protein
MAQAPTISRNAHGPGLDYGKIRSEALECVQKLAGEIWTDYNEHDPGVTTLEQLCYALTELSYRAALPLPDLLAGHDGRIDLRRQALFGPRQILPSDALTPNDYRRLLVDRVEGLGNAWLTPWRSPDAALDGLYDIALYAPSTPACVCEGDPPDPIIRQALGVYARHRGLCEDVHRIVLLRPLRATIHATVLIEGTQPPEEIMAELLYRAGQFLAPELRRTSLSDLITKGRAPSEIFAGPLLRNGFIENSELTPRDDRIDLKKLVEVIAGCRGVMSVNELSVRIGRTSYELGAADAIPVPVGHILKIDAGPDAKLPPIRLVRQGCICRLEPARVHHELARHLRTHRRVYPLAREYEHHFAAPRGRHRDLAQYTSIQEQYPAVYGIGQDGLEASASPLRRAQAKQLKGYLAVFEQLMADYLAQLAHVCDLLSTDATLDRSTFTQSIVEAIPNGAELFIDYPVGAERLRRERDPWIERRNRILDVLLALYAEEVVDQHQGCEPVDAREAGLGLIARKLDLLGNLARASRMRGRAFDYLAQASARNVSGLELKASLNFRPHPHPGQHDHLRLHVVEHILLRPGRHVMRSSRAFDYAFTQSVIVGLPNSRANDHAFRRALSKWLRENAPAHLALQIHVFDSEQMCLFEDLHSAWRNALRARDARAIVLSSIALRGFLSDLSGSVAPSAGDDR